MSFGLPEEGDLDWAAPVNDSIEAIRSDAATAKADAASARDTAIEARAVAQASGDVTDSGVAYWVANASSTKTAVDARIDAKVPQSSTTAQGKVELATNAEVTTGTDITRAVTPAGVKTVLDPIRDLSDSTFSTALNASYAGKLDNASTSTNGALTVEKLTKVDASGAARAMTIPDGTIKGQQVAVEKTDTSTNAVTVTGKIRSTGSSSITLTHQYETLVFIWGGTFWEPLAGHRTKASLDAAYAQITKRPINLRDYAAATSGPSLDFTGTTDSAAALNTILTAAGGGAKIEIGRPGRLRLDSTVTTPAESILDGGSFQTGKYVGDTPGFELVFASHTGTQVALQLGPDSMAQNLLVRGPGNAGGGIGVRNDNAGTAGPSHSARLRGVSVTGFSIGIKLEDCYYALLDGIESTINDKAIQLEDCNNVTMLDPRLFCQSNWDGGTGRTGIEIIGALAGLNIFGGSIEEYGANGGLRLSSIMNATLHGVYFESTKTNAVGITTPGAAVTKCILAVRDSYVLLDNHTKWMNFDAVNSVLTSSGNRFTSTNSAATPFGYVVNPTNSATTGNTVDLRGDSWEEIAGASTSAGGYYCDSYALTARGYSIAPPRAYRVANFGDNDYRGRKPVLPASTAGATGGASLNIPHGAAPSSPADGDMWTTSAGLFVRINGVTKTVTLT